MATTATATLNGGPTGGLHATTTVIHSEESQQDETCRVDSNSSFDSGHEDIQSACTPIPMEDMSMPHWPSSRPSDSATTFSTDPSMGKKRRKQSRPVRIPASEQAAQSTAGRSSKENQEDRGQRAGTGSKAGLYDYECEKKVGSNQDFDRGDESCGDGESSEEERPSHYARDFVGKEDAAREQGSVSPFETNVRADHHHHQRHHHHHHHAPLNLSSKSEDEEKSGFQDNVPNLGHHHKSKEEQMDRAVGNEKTEHGGHGTKDSQQRNLNPSFSPALLPLFGSSQFLSFFPNGQPPPSQQQLTTTTAGGGGGGGGAPGTPSSSSSVGSNNSSNQHQNTNLLTSGAGAPLQNIPPHRIFNPEAYCDLCNKEFCNKYFLKTHKANKHGVYTDSPSSSGMPPSQVMAAAAAALTNITSSPSPFINVGPSAIICSGVAQQPSLSQSATSQGHVSSSGKTATRPDISGSVPKSSLPLDIKIGSSNSNSGSVSGQGTREAFCDLCQKEFCNKYFLKRHKAKIHGIPMDSLPSRSTSKNQRQNGSNGAGGDKVGPASLLMSSDLELSLEIVAQHMDNTGSGMEEEGEVTKATESMAAISPGQDSNSGVGRRSSNQVGDQSQCEEQQRGDDSKFKLSSLTHMKLPLGLATLGGSSVHENTCQFCFREFSSKSQLRSHLTKKHRLLLPTFPPFLLPFQGIGTPLFDETGGQQPSVAALTAESEAFDQSESGLMKEEVDYECNQCGRSFQTVYLLRMHKSYFHPESEDTITTTQGGSGNRLEDSSDVDSGKNTPVPQGGGDCTKASTAGLTGEGETELEAETTSDSDDLRRLQSMIMELNRASSAGAPSSSWSPPLDIPLTRSPALTLPGATNDPGTSGPSVCNICSKEFYSSYFLQQHIQHYHSANAEGSKETMDSECGKKGGNEPFEGKTSPSIMMHSSKERMPKESTSFASVPSESSSSLVSASSFLTPGPKSSSNNSNSGGVAGGRDSSGKGESSGKRPSPSLSRSYCTICHKELCNKYFMRTHMLKMHGISIESSTGLGGVTCDICNKELCSKYFLKVHKQNTHGIVDEGPSPPNPSTPGPVPIPVPGSAISSSSADQSTTAGLASPSSGDLIPVLTGPPGAGASGDVQSRYYCHYSEVCPVCGRRFRSSKWLKTHLMSDHGPEGKEKWKSIEKSLQQQASKKHPKSVSGSGASPVTSKSSSSKSVSKSKSGGSGAQIGISSNGSSSNKCALCGFTTQDVEIMKVHLIKEHASQLAGSEAGGVGGGMGLSYQDAQRVVLDPLALLFQKMEDGTNKLYRCAYCPFATTLLVYLYAHERTHTGLANSMTPQQQQQQQPQTSNNDPATTFQCPLCLHTFHQVEAFQQHLLGHQMSGVLAPFFNPPPSTSPPARFSFQTAPKSPTGLEQQHPPPPILPTFSSALSMLNGAVGSSDGLYWALKSSGTSTTEMDEQGCSTGRDAMMMDVHETRDSSSSRKQVKSEESRRLVGTEGTSDSNKDHPLRGGQTGGGSVMEEDGDDDNDENDESLLLTTSAGDEKCRKRRKLSRFRCSCCAASFKSRRECFNHIQENHSRKPQQKKSFRCRKCKFATSQYQRLIIHYRVHHGLRRGFQSENWDEEMRARLMNQSDDKASGRRGNLAGLPEGRAIPQQGVLGDYVMQPFLLCCSSDEDKGNGNKEAEDDGGQSIVVGSEKTSPPSSHSKSGADQILVRENNNQDEPVDHGNNKNASSSPNNNNHDSKSCTGKIQSGLFVPSLVYLPVREKVSQSVRVSFSLTPTS